MVTVDDAVNEPFSYPVRNDSQHRAKNAAKLRRATETRAGAESCAHWRISAFARRGLLFHTKECPARKTEGGVWIHAR